MPLKNKEILIIEDDLELVLIIKKLLEPKGARISHAQTIEQGLNMLAARSPHCILLDLNLDQENGLIFLKRRQELGENLKSIPVMIMTANSSQKIQQVGLALGANEFYEKPIKSLTLIAKIKSLLKEFSFKPFIFEKDEPLITIEVDAEITQINELKCMIATPVRLAPNTSIQIKGKIINDLDMNYCKFMSVNDCGRNESGYYRSEVSFIGIQEKTSKKIRALPGSKD